MKVLITGGSGGLASAVVPDLIQSGHQVVITDVVSPQVNKESFVQMNICDKEEVEKVFVQHKPNIAFHFAALTDVDRCEDEPTQAYKINATGTENIALSCKKLNIPMVYVSTIEVYDGKKVDPYVESDPTGPVNVYAKSKLEGENFVKKHLKDYFIIRSAWLVGGGKKDKKFVTKIVSLLETKKEIQAVNDKIGSPTFVTDLSHNLLKLVETRRFGLYHMCNQGHCSRYELANKIVTLLGKTDVTVNPVPSSLFKLSAPRGRSEAVINQKLNEIGLNLMPTWESSLEKYLKKEF